MRRAPYLGWKIAVCLLAGWQAVVCLPPAARADTIILKNGRHIVAGGVTFEDGKVSFETSSGHLSLPESMVDRVQRDKLGLGGSAPSNPRAADVYIAPPHNESADGDATALVVHNGVLDRGVLDDFDAAAVGGAPDAVARAVRGESAAVQVELDQGHLDEALTHAKRAAALSPSQVSALLQLAYINIMSNDNASALETLTRARELSPDSADARQARGLGRI